MSKLEITGIKIESESDIESITININYKPKDLTILDESELLSSDSRRKSKTEEVKVPFKQVY